ncbi:hypothetical protein A6A04_12860 [Paramagnetospirillum marisnigri]|uniref:Uncharacterized protein n=1 Tax=Paramagnetospirillum marisnigri TaxID=1285242 RepID=A0A178MVB7_9PROT|nr:hypothetical protein [Paramagnetospirillum marisnigri]OAN54157.1 hypothetical protein A6A04_12860 [Paramagnetospirillum marisnigri]
MRCKALVVLASLLVPLLPAWAADEAAPVLAQPVPAASSPATPSQPAEETPGFLAVRPLTETVAPAPVAVPAPAPVSAPVAPPVVVVPPPPPPPAVEPAPAPPPVATSIGFGWEVIVVVAGLIAAAMLALGAAIAGWTGTMMARSLQASDETRRRQAAKTLLVVELEARRQAFEAVPVPPNADAGVSFVSAVCALADMDSGWQAAQTSLHLLGEKQAGHLAVHYSAVRYVANFVKGQSFAAALRMLQANRIGGHPCPDPAAMREAHVELAAAFRGIEKIIQGLKG